MAIATWAETKRTALDTLEREYWGKLHDATMGNISEMARVAGTERVHVRAYMRRLGLDLPARPGPRFDEREETRRRLAELEASSAVEHDDPSPSA
jgi:hypothetical protein